MPTEVNSLKVQWMLQLAVEPKTLAEGSVD